MLIHTFERRNDDTKEFILDRPIIRKQWTEYCSYSVGHVLRIEEETVIGYILDNDGEKCENDFSLNYEQQRRFWIGTYFAGQYGENPVLTNDKGEEVTEENYDEWANSFIEKVYNPFLEKIGL